MADAWSGVQVTRQAGIVTITLDRAGRKNAMTDCGWRAITNAARDIDVSTDRVVVIQGAHGDFCAGADLGDESSTPLERLSTLNAACLAVHHIPCPTIAKIDGDAIGAGLNLALACDFVLATERSRFSEIFVRRGLSVDFGGSWVLPRLVGLHAAKELVLLGEIIDAATARDIGLVRTVVPSDRLDAAADDIIQRLGGVAPVAIRLSKQLLNESFQSTLESSLAAEGLAQSLNLTMHDAGEAAAAFFEKRPAVFTGQ